MGASKSTIVLVASGLLLWGCSKHSDPIEKAAAASEPKPAATQLARPTTQELLSGKTKRLRLPNTPLTIVVPDSWKIDNDGPVTFVVGPSLSGTATIGLSAPGTISFKQQEIDALVSKLPTDAQTHPEQFRREEHRSLGSVQVIEKRYLGKPLTRDKLDAKGDPIPDSKGGFATVTSVPVEWTLTVFVPDEQNFTRYELSLIDLDADQLTVDEPLLDKVMASVTCDGAPPTSAATTLP